MQYNFILCKKQRWRKAGGKARFLVKNCKFPLELRRWRGGKTHHEGRKKVSRGNEMKPKMKRKADSEEMEAGK